MKHILIIFIVVINCIQSYAQSDSIEYNIQDFNYLTAYTEANYAAYPSIIEHGYAAAYQTLKENIQDSIKSGAWGIKQAVCEYAYWFSHQFDAHYYADLPFFWRVCKRRDTPDYARIMQYAPKAISQRVDKSTWVIRIPSCTGQNPTNAWVAEAVNTFLSSGCKNLILDIRGNSGGSDAIWEPLIPLMIDHHASMPEKYFFRNTYNNRYHPSIPDWMIEQLKVVKDDQPFVVWGDDEENSDDEIPPHDSSIHIAIIIDKKTGSAGETILRVVRKYTHQERYTIYGKENSAGCAETGNILPFRLPHSRIQIYYPTIVSSAFLGQKTENKTSGIEPDIRLDLPYPKQLTDNIDSWVLWVSKNMSKRK